MKMLIRLIIANPQRNRPNQLKRKMYIHTYLVIECSFVSRIKENEMPMKMQE